LKYLFETPLRSILVQVTDKEHPRIPTDANVYVFDKVQFERIVRRRLGIVEPPSGIEWQFGVWRQRSNPGVTPFPLVNVLYDQIVGRDRLGH